MKLNNQKFMVTSQGVKKATGEPYCICNEIIATKAGGEFVKENSRLFLDEVIPVGTRFEIKREIVQTAR